MEIYNNTILQHIINLNNDIKEYQKQTNIIDYIEETKSKEDSLNNMIDEMGSEANNISDSYNINNNIKPKYKEYHISRNDKCPCGSGKKYKNCCLKSGQFEQYLHK